MYAIALIKVKPHLNVKVKMVIESATSITWPCVCKYHKNVDISLDTMVISNNAKTASYLLSISLMPAIKLGHEQTDIHT
jgi:hypothetical protein